MRFRIVTSSDSYQGMDRPRIATEVPYDLLLREVALPETSEFAHRQFFIELQAMGRNSYDLLALGKMDGPDWEFLGYDVGENNNRAWSALTQGQALPLNAQGLFDSEEEASQSLTWYLESEDDDRGPEDPPDLYAVIPIYRLKIPEAIKILHPPYRTDRMDMRCVSSGYS